MISIISKNIDVCIHHKNRKFYLLNYIRDFHVIKKSFQDILFYKQIKDI